MKGKINLLLLLITGTIFFILSLFSLFSCRKHNGKSETKNELIIDSMLRQGKDSMSSNISFSRKAIEKAMKLAPDSQYFYEAFNLYALSYSTINQYDSANMLVRKTMNYCKRQELSPSIYKLLASCNNIIGFSHLQMSNPDSAILYYRKALTQYTKANITDRIPDMYISLADAFIKKGNYAACAFYYRKALSISDSLHLTNKTRYPIYLGLGQVYMELRDFELSDFNFRLAEKYYKSMKFSDKFTFCNNRGNYYYYKKEYAKALPWFKKAQNLASQGDYPFYINLCYLNLGDVYLNLNQPDSVLYYINKSRPYFLTIKNRTALYYIATIRAGLALKQNDTKLARKVLIETKDSSGVEINILSIRNKYLQEYCAKTGNFEKAYHFLLKNIAIDDSIRNDIAKKRTAELELRYKQDTILISKKLLIEKQASQISHLKLISFIWILITVFIIVLSVFIYLNIKRERDLQWMKYIDQVTKLRMENIRNRLSPHFVFNVLNNEIGNLEEDKRKNLHTLIKLLRKNLEISERISIALSEELDFVKSYIELQYKNLGEDFYLEWEVDKQICLNKIFILPMFIQIHVENAIKHALRPKEGNKILGILVTKENDGVNILIRDNGAGYFPKQTNQTKGTGTGLKVMYQTIQLLNAKNADKIFFTIQNIEKREEGVCGTEVKIYIPNNYKFE